MHARSGLRCALAKSNATPSSGLLNLFMSGQSSAAHHCRAAPYVLSRGLDLRGGDAEGMGRPFSVASCASSARDAGGARLVRAQAPAAGSLAAVGLPLNSSSRIPGTMITACGRLPVSNIANFSASTRSTNRPPRRPLWSWTTPWERWGTVTRLHFVPYLHKSCARLAIG